MMRLWSLRRNNTETGGCNGMSVCSCNGDDLMAEHTRRRLDDSIADAGSTPAVSTILRSQRSGERRMVPSIARACECAGGLYCFCNRRYGRKGEMGLMGGMWRLRRWGVCRCRASAHSSHASHNSHSPEQRSFT